MRGWVEASPSSKGVVRRMEVVGPPAGSLLPPDQGLFAMRVFPGSCSPSCLLLNVWEESATRTVTLGNSGCSAKTLQGDQAANLLCPE